MPCDGPFRRERLIIRAWSCLVLIAVVVLALHDAPALVVISLMAFLPRPHQLNPTSWSLRRQGLSEGVRSSSSAAQADQRGETEERGQS
jgi:hypothetical protein